jgi:hypothetical protein
MNFDSLDHFARADPAKLGTGPVALMIAEDRVELASTLAHLHEKGFGAVVVLAPEGMDIPPGPEGAKATQHVIRAPTRTAGITPQAVNCLIERLPGRWLHYCYNAEYLFYPFCEDRSVGEMVTWVLEERRTSILTYVIDLYAADLTAHANAVSRETAMLDSSGYFAEARAGPSGPMERQLDFFGGLRWRFEEHVAKPKRKIDRIGLFQARPGLRLRADHTLDDEEMNTYACPWHHSLTAAICSFRVAKALRTNPGSRHEVTDFRWHKSVPFAWSSAQLMELGLMEPGQWF